MIFLGFGLSGAASSFRSGKQASTVILPIQIVLRGQFYGAFVALLLFEIGGQPCHAVLSGQRLPYLVELPGILQGAYRKGGGKIIIAAPGCIFGRLFQPQPVTQKAPLPSLRTAL